MKPLTRIAKLCSEIRCAAAGADLSSETGACDMLAMLRQKLDIIEKQVAIAEKCARHTLPRFFRVATQERRFGDSQPGRNAVINVFRISYILGNQVTMSDGRTLILNESAAAELDKRVALETQSPDKEEDHVD